MERSRSPATDRSEPRSVSAFGSADAVHSGPLNYARFIVARNRIRVSPVDTFIGKLRIISAWRNTAKRSLGAIGRQTDLAIFKKNA